MRRMLFITLLLEATSIVPAPAGAAEPRVVEIRETAGIQRFGYPVAGEFNADGGATADGFRLLDGERVLGAQFSLLTADEADRPARWSVDFTVDLSPLETRKLRLVSGMSVDAAAKFKRGLSVEQTENQVRVLHPTLEFAMSKDLSGLFEAIRVGSDDYLVRGSRGLLLQLRDGRELAWADVAGGGSQAKVQIVKSGPLAAVIRFAGTQNLTNSPPLRSVVELDFPLGKSWVRTDWTIDDPTDAVQTLAAEVQLRLESSDKQPVLADVGAAGWTYSALRGEDALVFRATGSDASSKDFSSRWQVERILGGKATRYATPPSRGIDLQPQGWAHLMDDKRCTAIAMDRFADNTTDTMTLSARGDLKLRREFPPRAAAPNKKRFTFWLHVVKVPPQVGAVTSPQSMQTPPEITIGD